MAITLTADDDEVVSTINTTPLVDVMLVLLIIFLITVPVVTHSVPVELPHERNKPQQVKIEDINISVDARGDVYWGEKKVANKDQLLEKLKAVATAEPQPAIQIRGDGNVAYESIGRVVLACQRAGIAKIGFVTEPPPKS
jgi:biopolymer transport protein ExbD